MKDECALINEGLLRIARRQSDRMTLYDVVELLGRKSSEQFILRGTHYGKQTLAEGIATKVFQQYRSQLRLSRSWIFHAVKRADTIDETLLREIITQQGGTWKGFHALLRESSIDMGISAETAGAIADREPVRLRPLKKPFAYFRSRSLRFVKTSRGNYGILLTHPKANYRHLFFRILGRGRTAVIDSLLARTGRYRDTVAAELISESDRMVLCVMIRGPLSPENYMGRTFIGVDLGYVNAAVAAVINPETRRLVRSRFWSAKSLQRRLRALERRESINFTERTRHKSANFRRHWTHRIAREIVDFARTHIAPIIVLENLRGIQARAMRRGPVARRSLHRWDYRRMSEYITYKAAWEGIRVIRIVPKGTSTSCPRCSQPVFRDRTVHVSRCINQSCRYENNDDLLGAYNVALRGLEHEASNDHRGFPSGGHSMSGTPRSSPSTLVHPNVESLGSAGSESGTTVSQTIGSHDPPPHARNVRADSESRWSPTSAPGPRRGIRTRPQFSRENRGRIASRSGTARLQPALTSSRIRYSRSGRRTYGPCAWRGTRPDHTSDSSRAPARFVFRRSCRTSA